MQIVEQISPESSGEDNSILLNKLVEELYKKHGKAYEEAKALFPNKTSANRELFVILKEQKNGKILIYAFVIV